MGNRLKGNGPNLAYFALLWHGLYSSAINHLAGAGHRIGVGHCVAVLHHGQHASSSEPDDDFYLLLLIVLFIFHPGLLYSACSGKSIYLVLIFFYLFFYHILRFYSSNTTFHVSIASICLVMLVFCDYKFIWLTLFFIPLVLFIATQSLNLGEKETDIPVVQSFNNPALRRKLINKTFAIYIILFILPLASILIYKMLNLTHANDFDYFLESPYATWTRAGRPG